jgi:outer membrane protein assembly factor BamB
VLDRGAGVRDAVIDLGEVPAGETPLPSAPVPYRLIAGLLTMVLLALLGGAGPPPPPLPAPVVLPLTLADAISVVGDRLFVIGPGEPIGRVVRTHTIRSYDLPGTNLLGIYTVTVNGDIMTVADRGDGMLVVGFSDYETGTPGTVAVRPGDAQPVWERPAMMFGYSPDRRLLLINEEVAPRTDRARPAWRALDPRTGAVLWSVEQPENGQVTAQTGIFGWRYPTLFHTLHGDGRLETRDGLTGAVTATGRYPAPVRPDTTFWSAGPVLMVGQVTGETVGYDRRTLTELWRRDDPVLPDAGYPLDCGPVICLAVPEDALIGIDPVAGREVWRAPVYDSTEVIGDRLLVSHVGQTDPALDVLDQATGRIVLRTGSWTSGGPGPEPGTVWVHRLRLSDNTVRYGLLDMATGGVRIRGAADRIAGDCQIARGVLLCRRLDSSVALWRL